MTVNSDGSVSSSTGHVEDSNATHPRSYWQAQWTPQEPEEETPPEGETGTGTGPDAGAPETGGATGTPGGGETTDPGGATEPGTGSIDPDTGDLIDPETGGIIDPGTGQIHFTLSSLPQGFSLCSRPWVYALDTASNIISREELPPAMTWPGLQPRRSANSLRAMGIPADRKSVV